MNIVRATAAGRKVKVGTRTLFFSPPTLRGLGMLVTFLQDRIEPPKGVGAGWLPSPVNDQAFAEYGTIEGAAMLLYVVTRRDHPDLTMDDAYKLACELEDDGITKLIRMAFIRPAGTPKANPRPREGHEDVPGIESVNLGPVFECENLKRFSPRELSEMTIDQFENALSGGEAEAESKLSFDEVMDIYEKYRLKKDEA